MEHFLEIAVGIILFALGLFMLTKPAIVWKIEHFLTVKNGEPTDWYLAITRLIGLGCIVVAVLLIIVFGFLKL